MRDMDKPKATPNVGASEFDRVMDEVRMILRDGIDHGFFSATISVQTVRAGRREVLISAGKSYKFSINDDDLPH